MLKRKLKVFHVNIHAPIAVLNTTNYIEWKAKNSTQAYIQTKSYSRYIKNSRYYFTNDIEHREIVLILMGYDSKTQYTFNLNFLDLKRNNIQKPILKESVTKPDVLIPIAEENKTPKLVSLRSKKRQIELSKKGIIDSITFKTKYRITKYTNR